MQPYACLIGAAPDEQTSRRTPFDARRPGRTVTLLMLGRLWHQGSDTICRIRDISPGGMRIETVSPLGLEDLVMVEARSGMRIEGHVAWTRRPASGIRFVQPVDSDSLLALPGSPGRSLAARAPRFRAATSATIQVQGRRSAVRVTDISLSGCAVACDTAPARDIAGSLAIPGLPPLGFVTRWTGRGQAGLAFLERIGFADLALWVENPKLRFAGC